MYRHEYNSHDVIGMYSYMLEDGALKIQHCVTKNWSMGGLVHALDESSYG